MLELQEKVRLTDQALMQLGKRGETYAKAEREYRVELQQEILKQRDAGTPVTIISDICRGTPAIAQKKFERDVAEISYKSALEAINVYKLQIRLLESQISREWGISNG